MTLKLYYDLMSQPSRALYIFLQVAKIPFESCPVALRNGAHYTPEFEQINRFKKVPCIEDGDFKLSESIAIMRYLSKTRPIAQHWYPNEFHEQALVDEFLEWQHIGLRLHCAMYFQIKWLIPIISGKEPKPEKIQEYQKRMEESLDLMENIWLKNGQYLTGSKITFADILAACEIEQPTMAGYCPIEGRPKLKSWLERVRKDLTPYYDDAHKIVYKIAKRGGKRPENLSQL